jgi:hypothetical protein
MSTFLHARRSILAEMRAVQNTGGRAAVLLMAFGLSGDSLRGAPMGDELLKTVFTARDPGGDDVRLVRFWDGQWGLLVNGQCSALGWPEGRLDAAARAYRERVLPPTPSQLRGGTHLQG